MAMMRDVPRQKQLSLAAWWGDLYCLQDLMVSSSDFNLHLPFDCLKCDIRQSRPDSIGRSLMDQYWPSVMIYFYTHLRQWLEGITTNESNIVYVLQARTDLMDLNKQNRDGLTPLMLAVRDVDLFEGLEMPWEYQPVEVVKELVSLQA